MFPICFYMFNEFKNSLLERRLWNEIRLRNRYSVLIHLIVGVLSIIVAKDMYEQSPFGLIYFAIIIFSSVIKTLIVGKICRSIAPSDLFKLTHHLCLIFMGLSWGLFWLETSAFYGDLSAQSSYALITILALNTSAIIPHSPKPIGYFCFSFSLIVIPCAAFFGKQGDSTNAMALSALLYFSYNFYQLRVSHTTLRGFHEQDLEIKDEQAKLQTTINAVPGFVFFIDKDLNYVMINEIAKTYFDMTNCVGVSVMDGNPVCPFPPYIERFMSGPLNNEVSELEMISVYGPRMVLLSIQKAQPHIGGAVIIAIPIDELIKSREIIKLQDAKTFNTAKLLSLGEMAAGIAHEINNPLAIILGYSDQILRMLKKPEPEYHAIKSTTEKIQSTVERISGIIKSLRILARNGEKDPYNLVDLNSTLSHSLQLSRQRFEENEVAIQIIVTEGPLYCLGQEVQLSQVVMNLMSNAFDAAVDGETPKWVRITTEGNEENILITVQDSGPGIPAELKNKIMDPFFTTKPVNKGTGLGLSVSKSIVEHHGGSLYLDEDMENTTFRIRLKAATTI